MASVTMCSDFRAREEEICHYFHLFSFYLPCSNGGGCHDLSFFKPALSLSFSLIKRLFSLLSAIGVVSSAYLRWLMFLPPILTPAWNSSRPAFLIMCSACRLNKQDDGGQPWHIPFSILNQSVVPYKVLTLASWPTYRFLRRQVRWSFTERWEYQTMLANTHMDIHKYLLPHTHRSPYT